MPHLSDLKRKAFNAFAVRLVGRSKKKGCNSRCACNESESAYTGRATTAGLDPKGRDEILATIKKLHEENKEMIIIFVSHSMEDVAKTAERVIVMNDGHVEMQGTVAEVFAQAEHLQKIGLNVPQVTLLTDKLRLAGYDLPEHIYTVKYAADAIKKLIGGGGNV